MSATRCRSYRYLLQPTTRQRTALEGLLRRQCELYNAALEERRGAWKWERRHITRFDQYVTLTGLKEVRPETLAQGVTVCRGTLKRLDLAFAAFYRRCRAGEKPGFPRFKSAERWDSVQWEDGGGWRLYGDQGRLRLLGIGNVKARLHRPWGGTPRAITVRREGRRWWVTVRCADVPATQLASTGCQVGIDLGVHALIATSDGELVTEGRHGRRSAANLATAQRDLETKRQGSNRRKHAVERVARTHRKVRNQRMDLAHQLSRRLVDGHDLLVHEDLAIGNMARSARGTVQAPGTNVAAKSGLNRSIYDAGWGQLLSFLRYKAEDAGREVIAVDPRHTSQRCAQCGHTSAANRVTQAAFRCTKCGYSAHADVNAAVNILRAGLAQRGQLVEGAESPMTPLSLRSSLQGGTET